MLGDLITIVLVPLGCFFFTVGTIGLLRFGDLRTRLHALTKADTLGLGLIVLGLLPQVPVLAGAKLVLIWALALGAAALTATLLAGHREGSP
ncbi:MAG: monovalent cation/H(+) antiporter subunit G [Propionibacteriaceae bacterium]|nr:monovalent cation/H(+) antiporter subunit G [Propionibacteriaceae bacterium]